jgi:hypothetical protein
MGLFTRMLDSVLQASWDRVREAKQKEVGAMLGGALASNRDNSDNQVPVRTFSIHTAINGQYIEFRRFKYNPNGPDEHEHCVYVVKDDEPLVDAISTVLVLMNGREDAAQ